MKVGYDPKKDRNDRICRHHQEERRGVHQLVKLAEGKGGRTKKRKGLLRIKGEKKQQTAK